MQMAKNKTIQKFLEKIDPGTLVAIAALILTQVPSIGFMVSAAIKGRRAEVSLPNQALFAEAFGNLVATLYLSIHNSGGVQLDIRRIDLILVTPSKTLVFPSQALAVDPSGAGAFQPMGTISLSPGDRWSRFIRFYAMPSDSDQAEISSLTDHVRRDIIAKLQPNQAQLVQIAPSLATEAVKVFDKDFPLASGINYTGYVRTIAGSGKQMGLNGFQFTLAKETLESFRNQVYDNYQHGLGFNLYPIDQAPVQLGVAIQSLQDSQTKTRFAQLQLDGVDQ